MGEDGAVAAEVAAHEIHEGTAGEDAAGHFTLVLRYLRGLGEPCAPPVGVGSFDLLVVSEREVLVWYTPARAGHIAGERTIPTARLAAAWAALHTGEPLDEATLAQMGTDPAVGRWLLAILAQVPGVRVRTEAPLTLALEVVTPLLATTPASEPRAERRPRRRGGV
ncbi:MAG: hypothetical protein IVW57_09490 [Ktedonobacterales bacterium]|nr:hypothetical protein [Ktedonobacterales bacterium]